MSKVQDRHQWLTASHGHAPPGTLVGGHDVNGEPIYVARALHNGDLIPGKLVATQHCAYLSWGGLEFKKDEYEVLVGGPNNWIATSRNNIPPGAFPGGKTQKGETLYVGRVHYQGTITTGKVQKSEGVCYIPFDNKEYSFTDYEILTYYVKKNLTQHLEFLLFDSTEDKNQWVKTGYGIVPPGSFVGGHDTNGENIYVARAFHENELIPGKLIASHQCVFISWAGEEIRKSEYEVLVGGSNNWIATSGSNTPPGALPGGYVSSGEKLFVGRVRHEGSITTGKIQQSHGVCYIPFGGKELRYADYEALTY